MALLIPVFAVVTAIGSMVIVERSKTLPGPTGRTDLTGPTGGAGSTGPAGALSLITGPTGERSTTGSTGPRGPAGQTGPVNVSPGILETAASGDLVLGFLTIGGYSSSQSATAFSQDTVRVAVCDAVLPFAPDTFPLYFLIVPDRSQPGYPIMQGTTAYIGEYSGIVYPPGRQLAISCTTDSFIPTWFGLYFIQPGSAPIPVSPSNFSPGGATLKILLLLLNS